VACVQEVELASRVAVVASEASWTPCVERIVEVERTEEASDKIACAVVAAVVGTGVAAVVASAVVVVRVVAVEKEVDTYAREELVEVVEVEPSNTVVVDGMQLLQVVCVVVEVSSGASCARVGRAAEGVELLLPVVEVLGGELVVASDAFSCTASETLVAFRSTYSSHLPSSPRP